VLKPVVKAVPWDDEHRSGWQQQMARAEEDPVQIPGYAFQMTGMELLMRDIPAYVTGVSAVGVAYPSVEDLERDLGVRKRTGRVELPGGALAGVIGRQFFIFDDPRYDELALLKKAVDVAMDTKFRRKRRAINEFQEDFLRGGATDRESVERALGELRELLDEERKAVPRMRLKRAIRYAFRLGAIGAQIALAAAGAPPVACGATEGFLSIGELSLDERFAGQGFPGSPSPAAFVYDVRRHFGWERAPRRLRWPWRRDALSTREPQSR
jgi:hypothetical protein